LLLSMNTSIPRYFLEASRGPRELGIFSAIAFLLSVGNLVVGALGQAAFVRLARAYDAADIAGFFALVCRLLAVGAVLGIGGVLVAEVAGAKLLTVLYRPEYAQRTDALVWLMIAAGCSYLSQFLGYAITAARFFKSQIPLFATATAAVTVACYFLVPSRGLSGAVFSILIAAMVQLAGCALILAFAVRKRSPARTA
jgi:O-antigen/teichoic acid export membrane protein